MSVADIPAAPPATGFARRHAWLAVLVVGAALFIAEERTLVATQNPNLVPSAILLGATAIVPLASVAFVPDAAPQPPDRTVRSGPGFERRPPARRLTRSRTADRSPLIPLRAPHPRRGL